MFSAILTALACWIFLGSFSATFNVILSIPTSIMGAFIVLYFMGFTLNTFTLLGLSLAIGIVVDDAIMVLENIFRHNEEGLDRMEAAIVGAREISFAAMAATIAIVAIFLPVAFMVGVIGKFFFQFGVTITVTVLLSLMEALTITPMRCSRFVTMHERTDFIGRNFERAMNGTRAAYKRALAVCLAHPWKVVVVAIVVMLSSFTSAKFIGKEFSPPQDQSIFLIRLKARVDASIPYTNELMKRGEAYMRTVPEIKQTYVAIGGFGGTSYNVAFVFVTLKQPNERPIDPKLGRRLSQQEIMAKMRPNLQKLDKGLVVAMQDLSMRGFTASRGFPIEFTIRGDNWEKLWSVAQDLMQGLKDKGLATDIDTDYLLGKPQVEIVPNRDQAALHGISVQDIGTTIGAMIGGVRANQYTEGGHRYYVMLQVQPKDQNLKTLHNLMLANTANQLTPMRNAVTDTIKPAMQSVTRIDRQRAISVFANAAPGHTTQEALDYIASREKDLPAGFRIVLSGSSQTFQESFQSLIFAFILGIFVAYMVLASQFNSFIDPITVLVALPFSVSGAFLALLLTRQSLNIYSMIGLILLMGIVKKNSILLVDFTNTVRDRGEKDVKKALLEACPVRLRPIVMTSFACITAAIPEALPIGTGSETTIPMAVSIIGGVMVSTFLTLFVVPCVYELFSRISHRAENKEEIKQAFIKVGNEGLDT
jgi:HAE1 family hydrophobic/amphiphilic exporter-1